MQEAVAVAVGLRAAARTGVSGIEETSVRALAKLQQVLPAPLRRRVGALDFATVPYPGYGPAVDAETLTTIAGACRDQVGLRFGYSAHDGARAQRSVQPHRLVHAGQRWYLVAWDLVRDDWRTFRVDRIDAGVALEGRFPPRRPPAADIVAYVARGVSSARDRYHARVLLHAPLGDVEGRVPTRFGTLEDAGEGRCVLSTGADWLGGLAVYIANIGVDFEVLDPPELRDTVAALGARFSAAARPQGQRRRAPERQRASR